MIGIKLLEVGITLSESEMICDPFKIRNLEYCKNRNCMHSLPQLIGDKSHHQLFSRLHGHLYVGLFMTCPIFFKANINFEKLVSL